MARRKVITITAVRTWNGSTTGAKNPIPNFAIAVDGTIIFPPYPTATHTGQVTVALDFGVHYISVTDVNNADRVTERYLDVKSRTKSKQYIPINPA